MPAFALLGSGEFEPWTADVDRWLLERSRPGPVFVAPTASAPEGDDVFERWGTMGIDHYAGLGIVAFILALRGREDAMADDAAAGLARPSMVFFSGGNPAYLVETLLQTPLWEAVVAQLDRGMAFAGCSAGAAALGRRCLDTRKLRPGTPPPADLWAPGLGLFDATIAPHWDTTERVFPGGHEVIRSAAKGPLLGLDERTALVGDGRRWTVMGSGTVYLRVGASEESLASGTEIELDLLAR